jgi:chorismate dehydratase
MLASAPLLNETADTATPPMIRLGHIDYSNCLPVHGLLLDAAAASAIDIVRGVPAELNAALAAGRIDVAPCSSIEYARHAQRYRILPGLAIGSFGAVGSILLESTRPLEQLGGRPVAVPTASATSVVLLRALLELRLGVTAELVEFEQADDVDPLATGAAAALRIGDPALRRRVPAGRHVHDLGRLWTEWTGLPFAFAVWQTGLGEAHDAELAALTATLHEARSRFTAHAGDFARRYAAHFGVDAAVLLHYWSTLCYELDAAMQTGLLHFYSLATRLGVTPPVRELRFTPGRG